MFGVYRVKTRKKKRIQNKKSVEIFSRQTYKKKLRDFNRLRFKTQFKIEFLQPFTDNKKKLEKPYIYMYIYIKRGNEMQN